MARWKALPEDLDPEVREFAEQLRRLVDGSGLSIAAVSDRTGYSKTSWDRYLNGRILAPKGAVVALAEVTGASPVHLTTLWELAERAWSRAEARHDRTMEQIRISQARAALGVPEPAGRDAVPPAGSTTGSTAGTAGTAGGRTPGGDGPESVTGPGHRRAASAQGAGRKDGGRRRNVMVLASVAGVVAVVAAAVFLTGVGGGGGDRTETAANTAAEPSLASSAGSAKGAKGSAGPSTGTGTGTDDDAYGADDDDDLDDDGDDADDEADDDDAAEAKCTGESCTGGNPEAMGCGGDLATTVSSVTVGAAEVEVRYSEVCRAAWARVADATPGDTLEISTDGKGLQSGVADAGGNAYTAMTAMPEGTMATACATVKATGAKTCTEEN
ncbi:DUF2690 domain-containing protein [Streptomyces sp. NPDC000594]|uniref:helix-turn-helix domain-containing protein n=1 Tax=Streptomyces sp. NPDC000594 TaxID=3154261 RepID=UPI00332B0FE7